MANSSIIFEVKDQIIKEMVTNEALFHAINSPTVKNFEDAAELAGTHIFPYSRYDKTLDEPISFLTIQVHTTQVHPAPPNATEKDKKWVWATVEIGVYSHRDCINLEGLPAVGSNRNDYLSHLIDKMLNGRTDFGYGALVLKSNTEDPLLPNYLSRCMTFESLDLNNQMRY